MLIREAVNFNPKSAAFRLTGQSAKRTFVESGVLWMRVSSEDGNRLRSVRHYAQSGIRAASLKDIPHRLFNVINWLTVRLPNLIRREPVRANQDAGLTLNLCLDLYLPLIRHAETRCVDHFQQALG